MEQSHDLNQRAEYRSARHARLNREFGPLSAVGNSRDDGYFGDASVIDKAMRTQHRVPERENQDKPKFHSFGRNDRKNAAIPGIGKDTRDAGAGAASRDDYSSEPQKNRMTWNLAFVSPFNPKVRLTVCGNRFYVECSCIRAVAWKSDASRNVP